MLEHLKPQQFPQFWRGWYRRAVALAELEAPLRTSTILSWFPVPRKGAGAPRWVRAREGEWAPYLTDHDFLLQVDWACLFRAAATGGPSPAVHRLCQEALVAARWFFEPRDPVLGHLIGRLGERLREVPRSRTARTSAAAIAGDEREVLLLEEHLLGLLDREPRLISRWATQMRAGYLKIAPRPLQLDPPGPVMVVDPRRVDHDAYFSACRPPATRPEDTNPDLARREAQWLLACNSWRDGARRCGDSLVIHLASYALVAQLLERETFLTREYPFPAPGAPKADWYSVGDRWGACLRSTLDGAWVTHRDPYELAEKIGWSVPGDAPLVALNLAALAGTAAQRSPAKRLRYSPGARLGGPRVAYLDYEGETVAVSRRPLPEGGARFYFEPPYDVPSSKGAKHHRMQVAGKVLWSLDTLEAHGSALAEDEGPRYPRVAAYARWARQQVLSLEAGGFDAITLQAARQAKVAAWEAGESKGLGVFVPGEDAVIADYLDTRTKGPVTAEELEILAARLPGRSPLAVKRRLRPLMIRKARELGWPTFRLTGWWPGNNEARVIYQRAKKRRGST